MAAPFAALPDAAAREVPLRPGHDVFDYALSLLGQRRETYEVAQTPGLPQHCSLPYVSEASRR